MDIKNYFNNKKLLVEDGLKQYMLREEGSLANHIKAMRYSLFAGGKRVRPILCIAVAEALHNDPLPLLPVACALECIHTYSLIHDDLPAMDDDELRRGKPTNHVVFGEAEAILAGDGLLSFAFELMSAPDITEHINNAKAQIKLLHCIAKAIGPLGMVGGQALDIDSEGKTISFDTLREIHSKKTGALITASVQAGAIASNATTKQFEDLTTYGENIGLAFQIVDDLLNVEGSAKQLGKAIGTDADRNKATYPAFFGLEETRKKAKEAVTIAISALADFDHEADPLRELAHYIYSRKK